MLTQTLILVGKHRKTVLGIFAHFQFRALSTSKPTLDPVSACHASSGMLPALLRLGFTWCCHVLRPTQTKRILYQSIWMFASLETFRRPVFEASADPWQRLARFHKINYVNWGSPCKCIQICLINCFFVSQQTIWTKCCGLNTCVCSFFSDFAHVLKLAYWWAFPWLFLQTPVTSFFGMLVGFLFFTDVAGT